MSFSLNGSSDLSQGISCDVQRHREIRKERQMVIAYKRIVETMGPSAQLNAFVDYDGSLPNRLGVGLESLSPLEQSQQILTTLNVATLDQLGLESVRGVLDKASRIFMVGGLVGTIFGAIAGKPVFAGVALATLLTGLATAKVIERGEAKDEKNNVISYSSYQTALKIFDVNLQIETHEVNAMPSTMSYDAWDKYYTTLRQELGEKEEKLIDRLHMLETTMGKRVPFDKSGWNAHNLASALQTLHNDVEKVDAHCAIYAKKVVMVQKFVEANASKADHDDELSELLFFISETMGDSVELYKASRGTLIDIAKDLMKVAHHFDVKK